MKKLIVSLLVFFLFSPIVFAEDVNISVNVIPAPPTPPIGHFIFGALFPLIIGAGGILFLLQSFMADIDPIDKIKLIIASVIVMYMAVIGIGLIT